LEIAGFDFLKTPKIKTSHLPPKKIQKVSKLPKNDLVPRGRSIQGGVSWFCHMMKNIM
jgi:hypothetical protein